MKAGEEALADLMTVIKGVNSSDQRDRIESLAERKEVIGMAVNEYLKVTAEERLRWQIKDREKFRDLVQK